MGTKQLKETVTLSDHQAHQERFQRHQEEFRSASERNDNDRTEFDRRISSLDSELHTLLNSQVTQCESNMQTWVDKEVIVRVNALDKQFRKEMIDRSAWNQQISDKITHNSERWV